jgi:hypothetical protein
LDLTLKIHATVNPQRQLVQRSESSQSVANRLAAPRHGDGLFQATRQRALRKERRLRIGTRADCE